MPMKINVGLCKKVGEANYGSRGASINIEVEADCSLANDQSKLQERIRQLYGVARQSLAEELGTGSTNGNNHKNGTSTERGATQSQIKALHAISQKRQFDLGKVLRDRFNVVDASALTIKQASQLIDEFKSNGHGG